MAQLLVRNVPERIVEALKRRAKENGRSAEGEARLILESQLGKPVAEFREKARRLRSELADVDFGDSADLIRADRDRR